MVLPQPLHILYIGHEGPAAPLFVKTLEDGGYVVSRTTDLRQAIPIYQQAGCHAVIFDPSTTAEGDFLEKIKVLATLPLIVIFSAGQEEDVPAALAQGADEFLIRDQSGGYLTLVPLVIERVIRQQYLTQQNQLVEAAIEENLVGIERAKQEWEATIDSLPQLICLLDDQGRIIRANLVVELWGLAPVVGIRGRAFDELLEMGDQWIAAWEMVNLDQPTEFEYNDPHLQRYMAVQVRPLSTQTSRRDRLSHSFAAVVVEDVTQRKEAEEALRQYAYQLEAHNQDLDAFAHTVAHDLQNPLGLVIGFSSALSKHFEKLTTEEIANYLHKIMETSRKMSNIIKELLLLASVRQQDVDLEPLDMARALKEARSRLSVFINDYEAELLLPDHWPIALGYSPWIEEVWVNYISNAIKYGGRPPRLTFGANMEVNGMVRFWIQDNGPGLTHEEQARLFQPFTRIHREKIQGHGLGLSIVRRIVNKLGGEVAVHSEGIPGQGTTFSFTLPSPEYSILTDLSLS